MAANCYSPSLVAAKLSVRRYCQELKAAAKQAHVGLGCCMTSGSSSQLHCTSGASQEGGQEDQEHTPPCCASGQGHKCLTLLLTLSPIQNKVNTLVALFDGAARSYMLLTSCPPNPAQSLSWDGKTGDRKCHHYDATCTCI